MANDLQTPAEYNISIKQGNAYRRDIVFTDEITGDTFAAKVKHQDNTEAISITCTPNVPAKTVTIALTDSQTATLLGNYRWYFERTRSSETLELLEGVFGVSPK